MFSGPFFVEGDQSIINLVHFSDGIHPDVGKERRERFSLLPGPEKYYAQIQEAFIVFQAKNCTSEEKGPCSYSSTSHSHRADRGGGSHRLLQYLFGQLPL